LNSNISNKELKIIKKSLPFLKNLIEYDESFIESNFYEKECISIFDHSLTREESNKLIFIDKDRDELYSWWQKFKNTILSLNEQTELFLGSSKDTIASIFKNLQVLKKCDFDNLWSNSG
jgi:hypothetical protein